MRFEYTVSEFKYDWVDYLSDFDGDDNLNKNDLEQTIRYLTRDELNEDEILFVVDRVGVLRQQPFFNRSWLQIIEEADLDSDGEISYAEFEHVVSRSPDFKRIFHIRL